MFQYTPHWMGCKFKSQAATRRDKSEPQMAELFKKISNIKNECANSCLRTILEKVTLTRQQFAKEIDVNILILCKTECVTTFHVTAKSFRFFANLIFFRLGKHSF